MITTSRLTAGAAALVLAVAGCATTVQASTSTDNVTFRATSFTSQFGNAVPVAPVVGAFQITFDPTQTYSDATAGITLTSLNIALGSALAFSYSPTGPNADLLIVGGAANGAGVIQISPSSNDFYLHINNFASGAASFGQLGYSQTSAGPSSNFYTTSAVGDSVTVGAAGAVPEPGTWALMLIGFAAIGGALRGRGFAAAHPAG